MALSLLTLLRHSTPLIMRSSPNSLLDAVPRVFADDTNLTLSAKTLTELKLALTPELNNLVAKNIANDCWIKAKLTRTKLSRASIVPNPWALS